MPFNRGKSSWAKIDELPFGRFASLPGGGGKLSDKRRDRLTLAPLHNLGRMVEPRFNPEYSDNSPRDRHAQILCTVVYCLKRFWPDIVSGQAIHIAKKRNRRGTGTRPPLAQNQATRAIVRTRFTKSSSLRIASKSGSSSINSAKKLLSRSAIPKWERHLSLSLKSAK